MSVAGIPHGYALPGRIDPPPRRPPSPASDRGVFEEILVATDETDVTGRPVRYRTTLRARAVGRLRSIVRELALQTGDPRPRGPDATDEVSVPTDDALGRPARDGARLHVLFAIDARKYDPSLASAVEPLEERGVLSSATSSRGASGRASRW